MPTDRPSPHAWPGTFPDVVHGALDELPRIEEGIRASDDDEGVPLHLRGLRVVKLRVPVVAWFVPALSLLARG